MDALNGTESNPPLYNGNGFPVEKLSPAKFEEFVFSCLQNISDLLDLRINGMPSGSGDGGFDIQAQNTRTKRIACIQCKHQQDPLSTPLVAEELAKVAATAALEKSDVGEHRFICTGGVRKKLVKQLRESTRSYLAAEAAQRITTAKDGELAALRSKLEEANLDAQDVVRSYVLKLDVLVAWSLHEFDVALSSRWQTILQIAERFFTITTVVREHPRATFDRLGYVSEHRDFQTAMEPRFLPAHLPTSISASSAANPEHARTDPVSDDVPSFDQICELLPGTLSILTGDGGMGKSAALRLLRARMLQSSSDTTLPVFISLSTYTAGGLDQAIHQELGVVYGNWRSLPDNVFLLCDGLNECPADHIDAFLSEIKPLLKRKRIACLISTRESTTRLKIVLPQAPALCTRLDQITPAGIRRIANYELGQESAEEFAAKYREFADSSYSKLLWTPFAVMVGIKLWHSHSTLPKTLGDMISALLKSRCERNIELSKSQLPAEVILLLAEALAFQCLLIDKRLECPAIDAGRWIRAAKTLCEDSLGISDLTETMAVELLVSHNLIHRSATGSLSFDHQLMVGALAAPLLSRDWRSHVDSLEETIPDDAWIFAAAMVSPDEQITYLESIFDKDLMLGARVSRELPMSFRLHAESLLDHCLDPRSPEHVQINAAYALALLGTESAISTLKKLASDKNNLIQHSAQHAIAATGDFDYLAKLLVDVDSIRSSPIRISGGIFDVWDHAPLPVKLDVVRQRLSSCLPGSPVGESLRLLAFERDLNDVDLVEKHLAAAQDISAWGNALRALRMISPARAQLAFERGIAKIQSLTERALLIRVAFLVGVRVNQDEAFACAIAEISPTETTNKDQFELKLLISEVVKKNKFSLAQIKTIEQDLPISSGNRRSRLWQLAHSCNSVALGRYAMSCISTWGNDADNACQYFIDQPAVAVEHRIDLIKHCERAIENTQNWYTLATNRALTLLIALGGLSLSAAHTLSTMIECAVRIVKSINQEKCNDLSIGDAELLRTLPSKNAEIYLQQAIVDIIPVIAQSRASLSVDVLLSLLQLDFGMDQSQWPDIRLALSGIPDEVIDKQLHQIPNPWTIVTSLAIISTRGTSPMRTSLLEKMLREFYQHPAAMTHLQKAAEASWCPEILEMILRFVSTVEIWSEYDTQFFWRFIRMVAGQLHNSDRAAIEKALTEAKTEFSRRILQFWKSQTLGPRVGFLSLS